MNCVSHSIEQYILSLLSISSLHYWAKENNPELYNQMFKKENIVIYTTDDNNASKIIFEEVKNILISYNGRLFYKNNNIWIDDKNKIDDIILTKITNSNIYKKGNDNNDDIPYCQNLKNQIKELNEKIIQLENK